MHQRRYLQIIHNIHRISNDSERCLIGPKDPDSAPVPHDGPIGNEKQYPCPVEDKAEIKPSKRSSAGKENVDDEDMIDELLEMIEKLAA